MVVIDRSKVASLDPTLGLTKADCIWGHGLVDLAEKLLAKNKGSNLDAKLDFPDSFFIGMSETDVAANPNLSDPLMSMPKTLRSGLERLDPFFSELRYPQELNEVGEIGKELKLVLEQLMALLKPFAQEQAFSLYM